jgi:hypothetical protein
LGLLGSCSCQISAKVIFDHDYQINLVLDLASKLTLARLLTRVKQHLDIGFSLSNKPRSEGFSSLRMIFRISRDFEWCGISQLGILFQRYSIEQIIDRKKPEGKRQANR